MKPSAFRKTAFLLLAFLGLAAFACAPKSELRLVLQVDGGAEQVAQSAEVLRQRLDMMSAGNSEITTNGNRVSIHAAGVEDPARLRRLLLAQADLEFRFVRFPESGGADSREAVLEHFGGNLPPDVEILEGERRGEDGAKQAGVAYYAVEKQQAANGEGIQDARPSMGQFDNPILTFRLKPEAAAVFGDMTEANIGKALAIVLNNEVISAPVIRDRIAGAGVIEGNFTEEELLDLAILLRSGALPAPVTVVEEASGADS